MATCHLEARSGDWPSESARLIVRCYVREAGNLSCYGDRLGTATIAAETPLFLRVARLLQWRQNITPGSIRHVTIHI